MKRRFAFALCIAVAIAVGPAAQSGRSDCGVSVARCYAWTSWMPDGSYSGALAYIKANSLTKSGENWVLGGMWVYPGDAQTFWVEHGIQRKENGDLAWYWTEANTCVFGGIFQHPNFNVSASLGVTYAVKTSYNGLGGKWAIYRDGDWLGNTAACYTNTLTDGADTGLESTAFANSGSGVSDTLQKRGLSGVWSYNWGGAQLKELPLNSDETTASSTDPSQFVNWSQQ